MNNGAGCACLYCLEGQGEPCANAAQEKARRLWLWHIRELEDLQAALPTDHIAQPIITDKLNSLREA